MEGDLDFVVAGIANGFFFGSSECLVKLIAFERALSIGEIGKCAVIEPMPMFRMGEDGVDPASAGGFMEMAMKILADIVKLEKRDQAD
jgi:hypothetical protein